MQFDNLFKPSWNPSTAEGLSQPPAPTSSQPWNIQNPGLLLNDFNLQPQLFAPHPLGQHKDIHSSAASLPPDLHSLPPCGNVQQQPKESAASSAPKVPIAASKPKKETLPSVGPNVQDLRNMELQNAPAEQALAGWKKTVARLAGVATQKDVDVMQEQLVSVLEEAGRAEEFVREIQEICRAREAAAEERIGLLVRSMDV